MGMVMRRFWLLLLAIVLGGGLLLFVAPAAQAADCYLYAGDVYVCDARPRQVTFGAPGYINNSIFLNRNYAWLEDNTPLYAAPESGARVSKEGEVGQLFYTIKETFVDGAGTTWYKVADNQWARADTMHRYTPPTRTGVLVHGVPERPFGWVMQRFQASTAPDVEAPENAPMVPQYTFVQLYGVAEGADGWLWFDIGDGQWTRQTNLALVDYVERPEDVGPNEYWVSVDLFEQTFAAYEGDRMVYAGLVASGLDRWPTHEGLFTVWDRHLYAPMSGGEVGDDFYNIQHVPHPMYFDEGISLHGAYWHNGFGRKKSHGCVNLPPRDAEWLYFWAEAAPSDLRVYVHSNDEEHILDQVEGGTLAAATFSFPFK